MTAAMTHGTDTAMWEDANNVTACQVGFEARPGVVPWARRHITAVLGLWNVGPADIDAVVLVVSELVTNAICHGQGPIGLASALAHDSAVLVIEVSDRAPTTERLEEAAHGTTPRLRPVDDNSDAWKGLVDGGRGLELVRHVTQELDVVPTATGKTVRAQLKVTRQDMTTGTRTS